MSKNNETNQTAPEFKIESCKVCPARDACDDVSWHGNCETRKKIEALVNGKR